jgi:molecular chaperone DnaK (HSP70)
LYYHFQLDENTDIKVEDSFQQLGKRDRYMIVDIGGKSIVAGCTLKKDNEYKCIYNFLGETTDVTVHSRSDLDDGVDEVLIPYTGPWGGNYVNKKLIDFLCDKYKIGQTLDRKTRQHLIDQFQCAIRKPNTDEITLQLPKKRLEITVTNAELDAIFEDPLQKIQELLEEVFNKEEVDVVILMGGFSNCERVKLRVQEIFEDKTVLIPEEPGFAMLTGAVHYMKWLENKNLKSFTVIV